MGGVSCGDYSCVLLLVFQWWGSAGSSGRTTSSHHFCCMSISFAAATMRALSTPVLPSYPLKGLLVPHCWLPIQIRGFEKLKSSALK